MRLILTIEAENMNELFNILKNELTLTSEASAPVVEDAKPVEAITLTDLQGAATNAIAANSNNKTAIRRLLMDIGVKKITELNESDYDTVYKAIKSL